MTPYPLVVVVLHGGRVHTPVNSLFINNPTLPILIVPLLEPRVIHSSFLLLKRKSILCTLRYKWSPTY